MELRLILNNATIADANTIALTQCVIDPAVFLLLDCLLKANHNYFGIRFALFNLVGVFQEKHMYSLKGEMKRDQKSEWASKVLLFSSTLNITINQLRFTNCNQHASVNS